MAEEKIIKSGEVLPLDSVLSHIQDGNNFLLSGGAGSGKTYTLVQVISRLIIDNPTEKIACITFTNSAAEEVQERIGHDNLIVSTYHDFFWDTIKHFQNELKTILVQLINDEDFPHFKAPDDVLVEESYFDDLKDGVEYKEFTRISDGVISHDEIPVIAEQMYAQFPKIGQLLSDRYPYILVDEYQDTQPEIVRILLNHISAVPRKSVIGFFGDSMQCIYEKRTGDLNTYIGEGKVVEVKKTQNRRSPQFVIDLANQLRTDGLTQKPSKDSSAPNMNPDGVVKTGSIQFLYSKENNLDAVRNYLSWDFSDSKNVKELNLTHNLIAGKAGFDSLLEIYDKDRIIELKKRVKKKVKEKNINTDGLTFGEVLKIPEVGDLTTNTINGFITEHKDLFAYSKGLPWESFSKLYVDKDQLIDDKKQSESDSKKKGSKRDDLIKHLFRIEDALSAYKNKNYNFILRKTDFKITSIASKQRLQEAVIEINDSEKLSIGEVIDLAVSLGLVKDNGGLSKFQRDKEYLYERISKLPYADFRNLYEYLEGRTQFSTQHKVKGNEFDNVLVIMDNGRWNLYNFKAALLGVYHNANVLQRSQKLLYTCFTRSKESLAVFYVDPTQDVLDRAEELFGNQVIDLDNL